MQQDKLWLLIANKLSGEATAEEMRSLSEYLQTNVAMAYRVSVLLSFWQKPAGAEEYTPAHAVEKIMRKIQH